MVGGGADSAEDTAAQAGDAAQGAAADASGKAQGAAASAGNQAQGMAAEAGAPSQNSVQSYTLIQWPYAQLFPLLWIKLKRRAVHAICRPLVASLQQV